MNKRLILLTVVGYISAIVKADYNVQLTRINQKYPAVDLKISIIIRLQIQKKKEIAYSLFQIQTDFTRGDSDFTYNYNPSYVPIYDDKGTLTQDALMIRAQQALSQKYEAGPSMMPVSTFTYDSTKQTIKFDKVTTDKVVFQSQEDYENYGVEDPRVAYRASDKTYYMMYSAVQEFEDKSVVSQLSLATTKTPLDKTSWQRQGHIFDSKDVKWSKSGALIFRDVETGPHYLLWGDDHITVATTTDFKTFTNAVGPPIIAPRPDHFDSTLVESGPPPLKLADGNYLFFYNSARDGFPSDKPGYNLQYNVGYVILDGTDPTKVLQRSSDPILQPIYSWEVGDYSTLCLVPRVVFLEAAKPLGNDQFLVFYGGADSVVGSAIVTVTKS